MKCLLMYTMIRLSTRSLALGIMKLKCLAEIWILIEIHNSIFVL